MQCFYKTVVGLLSVLLLSITVTCSNSDEAPTTVVEAPQQQLEMPPAAQGAPQMNDESAAPARLAVGEKALAFRLQDQGGNWRSLEELLAVSKVALVFFRSADW